MSARQRSRVFIGDVHGCADELQDLLEALRYDPATHALHFVGDLVNRGPKSLQTLRDVVRLGAESVLGNHELHLLARAGGARQPAPLDTLDELLGAPDLDALLGWVTALPMLRLWPDLALVHAGLPPSWINLETEAGRINAMVPTLADAHQHPDIEFLASVRYCDAEGRRLRSEPGVAPRPVDGRRGSESIASREGRSIPWFELYQGHRMVVFGHWATRGLVHAERLRGLDTGCVWGGRLTAWIAENDEFVSVAARKQYLRP